MKCHICGQPALMKNKIPLCSEHWEVGEGLVLEAENNRKFLGALRLGRLRMLE